MLGNSIEYGSKFTHKPMQDIASFARTMNMATAAIAQADENIQNTATQHCVINGVHTASLTSVTPLDISADLQLTTWLTATAYTAVDVRFVTDANGHKQWYKCIASHTSAASNKPGLDGNGDTWRTYWTESSNRALNAKGMVVANGYTRYVLVLANSAGTMVSVNADNGLQLTAAAVLTIPEFDPEVFVALGLITITGTDSWVYGDTDKNAQCVVTQLIGPVFPTGLGIDAN